MRSRVIDVQGWPIHAMEAANARPPLVLVHGVGLSHRYMMPTAEQLVDDFSVYVPDLPGFGYSHKPGRTLTVDELADALAHWMEAIDLPRAMMLGNSFGCQVIVSLAARHPQRISRAVLQGLTIDPNRRTWREQYKGWQRNNELEHSTKKDLICYLDYLQAGVWRAIKTFKLAMDDQPEKNLPHVQCPTLVVRGSLDPIISQQWAEEMVKLLPRGTLRIIDGVSHTLTFMAPKKLADACRPFLSGETETHAQHHRDTPRPEAIVSHSYECENVRDCNRS